MSSDGYCTLSIGGNDGLYLRLLHETAIGYEEAILGAMRENQTFLLRVFPAIAGAPTRSIVVTPHSLVTVTIPPFSWDAEKSRQIAAEALHQILTTGLLSAKAVE